MLTESPIPRPVASASHCDKFHGYLETTFFADGVLQPSLAWVREGCIVGLKGRAQRLGVELLENVASPESYFSQQEAASACVARLVTHHENRADTHPTASTS